MNRYPTHVKQHLLGKAYGSRDEAPELQGDEFIEPYKQQLDRIVNAHRALDTAAEGMARLITDMAGCGIHTEAVRAKLDPDTPESKNVAVFNEGLSVMRRYGMQQQVDRIMENVRNADITRAIHADSDERA